MPRIAVFLRSHGKLVALTVTALALLGTAVWSIDRLTRMRALASAQEDARNEAMIIATSLQAELDKFSLVPLVLAEDPQVSSLLAGAQGEPGALNRRLEYLARQTNAAVIYLMDEEGLTRAASNWNLPTTFVGSNYSFRRYFQDAMQAGSATQFALGTVSREPGLYIAQRVVADGRPLGVVAVKVEFDALEANWRAATNGVFVTDGDGVVLLASNEDWRFRVTDPQLAAARDRALDRQQFGVDALEPLDLDGRAGIGRAIAAPPKRRARERSGRVAHRARSRRAPARRAAGKMAVVAASRRPDSDRDRSLASPRSSSLRHLLASIRMQSTRGEDAMPSKAAKINYSYEVRDLLAM